MFFIIMCNNVILFPICHYTVKMRIMFNCFQSVISLQINNK